MKKSARINHERHLRWEKVKQDKAMQQVILRHSIPLVERLVEVAMTDGNPQAINSLLDRAFGKARQNIGLDGGADDKPIVFMPAQLMAKYALKAGKYTEIHHDDDYVGDPAQAMLVEPQ